MPEQQTITIEELKAAAGRKKPNKYRNQIIFVDGEKFHSKKEYAHWQTLKAFEKQGVIRDLKRQVQFDFVVNGQKIGHYTADMQYVIVASGQTVTVDVKSPVTRLEKAYRIRMKLLRALHSIEITEV